MQEKIKIVAIIVIVLLTLALLFVAWKTTQSLLRFVKGERKRGEAREIKQEEGRKVVEETN